MIEKRKLFSKGTLTPEEKKKRRNERAADRLDESRGKVSTAAGIGAGSIIGLSGLSLSEINRESKLDSVDSLYVKKTNKELDRLIKDYDKIKKAGEEVLKKAKNKLKKTGNPFTDAINEIDEATRESRKRSKKTLDAAQRLSDRINRKANSRNKKIAAGAILAGIGVGALSNRSMKKRADELRQKAK